MDFLAENGGTIIVAAILILVLSVIIYKLRKDKKQGKGSCGCGCQSCPNSEFCMSKKVK